MEKVPAGGRVSALNPDHLKPMRKRKRKEYLSPSEEDSDIEGTVGTCPLMSVCDVWSCLLLDLCWNSHLVSVCFPPGREDG